MPRVLIVDDSPVDRRLAGGLLQKHADFVILYAENGRAALEILKGPDLPDIVVTDLQMPEMNGLELVSAIQSLAGYRPPVVLMTAHGSEEIAVEALATGAASYVPKSRLAERLVETLEHLLAMSRADRTHRDLIDRLVQVEFHFKIENDTAFVPSLVDFFQHSASGVGLCTENGRIRLGIALEEALLNAIYHGNLEITSKELIHASKQHGPLGVSELVASRKQHTHLNERRVHIHANITSQEARFTIRDEGPGFNPGDVPDPTAPENLERECGRGMLLMRSFMDAVEYNSAGNQVTLIKLADSEDDEADDDESHESNGAM